MGLSSAMTNAVIGAIVTAAISTVGDYLWANVLPHGQPVYWFAHAIVLFSTIGACLGLAVAASRWRAPSARWRSGASRPQAFGFLRPLVGYAGRCSCCSRCCGSALGVLTGRVLQRRDNIGAVLVRSALAAVGSGLGVLRDLRDLDAVQSARLGLREAFHLLDVAYLPAIRGVAHRRRHGRP